MRMKLSKMIEHEEGRPRIVIEGVTPEIDGGRFPIKRIIGDKVAVEADIFADGHDVLLLLNTLLKDTGVLYRLVKNSNS